MHSFFKDIYIYRYKYVCRSGCCFSTLRCYQVCTDESGVFLLYVMLHRKLNCHKKP